jgi:ATP-dependent Zn protease
MRAFAGSALLTHDDIHDRIVALLSGRAAEQVLLGRVTSGAGGPSGSDLQQATWLAASAAAELGLEVNHGLAWTPLPTREAELTEALAADTRLAALVRRRLASAYDDALVLTRRSKEALRAVAGALLERGALDGGDVRRIARIDRVRP